MGKKRKQKKKIQRHSPNKATPLSIAQLMARGKERLQAGKARDAIEDFKLALKSGGAPDEAEPLLFRAYLMRGEQLRRKGMVMEAEVLMKQARRYMPPVERMTGEHICACIHSFPANEAFEAYSGYAAARGRSPEAERLLAGRILRDGCWKSLALLDASGPLSKDAPHVQAALAPMNEGRWEDALDLLRPLSRSSPYSSVRLFCRSMAAFYRDDMPEMRKALSLIPEDFPLSPVVREMQAMIAEDGETLPSDSLDCLWEGPAGLETEMAGLMEALTRRRLAEARQKITGLSGRLYPADPVAMQVALFKMISRLVADGRLSPDDFEELAERNLPVREAAFLCAQTTFMGNSGRSLAASGNLIGILEHRFSDLKQRNIAHGLILHETVRRLRRGEIRPESNYGGFSRYRKQLGLASDEFQSIPMEMTLKAIELDPEDRTGYEILAELPRHGRGAKGKVEKAFVEMARLFPDDPFPCLELARVFSEKNALRKAQDALEEAARRAPHDNRVVDRQVIALLASAQRNMKRKKPHLVAADLERAENLKSPATAVVITEKRILYEIVFHRKNLHLVIEDRTGSLPLRDRLRILGLLSLDLDHVDFPFHGNIVKALGRVLKKDLGRAGDLASGDVVRVLTPLDRDLKDIYPYSPRDITPVFSSGWKDMLQAVNDSDFLTALDHMMSPGAYRLIDREIGKRKESAEPRYSVLMEFYGVVVRQLVSGTFDPNSLGSVADRAKGTLLEEMRTIARRLSVHARGPLREALETFRFDIFRVEEPEEDEAGWFWDDDDDDDDDDEMEDEDDTDFFPFGNFGAGPGGFVGQGKKVIVRAVESMIDQAGLRGAPDREIREYRGDLRSSPQARNHLDALADLARILAFGDLSREARILLYGKR